MNGSAKAFVRLSETARLEVLGATASRLNTLPAYVEKDLWVCIVLDVLFNHLPAGHPQLLFKGGTSISKAFGLINRFSEDIDLVVYRDSLGFEGERDPTIVGELSNKKRRALFAELKKACSAYIHGDLQSALRSGINEVADGCRVGPDETDTDAQSLFVEYPTLFPSGDLAYVVPRVKIEGGARSAVEPRLNCKIAPYIDNELRDWSMGVTGISVIAPERTFWEKLLILHGIHCGYRDSKRLPTGTERVSRHYYDVAMITATEIGRLALSNFDLLDAVRSHNLIAFRQAWKRFDEAVPGSVRLVPQPELRTVIERDYTAMQHMILGDVPQFEWIIEQLEYAEASIN